MNRQVYSIRDRKAEEYLGLVIFKTELEAQRFFALSIMDKRGNMWRFPRDYALFLVGSFDTETGFLFKNDPIPREVTPFAIVDQLERVLKEEENSNGATAKPQG